MSTVKSFTLEVNTHDLNWHPPLKFESVGVSVWHTYPTFVLLLCIVGIHIFKFYWHVFGLAWYTSILNEIWIFSSIFMIFLDNLKLEKPFLEIHILLWRTGIGSWNLFVNLALVLDNSFPVLCNLKYISFFFLQKCIKCNSN